MAQIIDGAVPNDALTTFMRELPTPQNHFLEHFLPNKSVPGNKISMMEITKKNRAAKFRAWDGRIPVTQRDSAISKELEILPLSNSLNSGEYERLRLNMVGSGASATLNMLKNAMYNDAEQLTTEIHNRVELARGDAILDGKFTLAENGVYLEADFGVPANHLITAATAWSNYASADPIVDLQGWVETYKITNGHRPEAIYISSRIMTHLMRNDKLRNYNTQVAGVPGMLPEPAVLQTISMFGLPPVVLLPDFGQVYVDDVATPYFPDDRVIMVSSGMGYTAWGTTVTAMELMGAAKYDMTWGTASGIVGVLVKDGPPFREFIYADACAMPIIENPKLLMVADVL